ncbi:single-stranded-DNA-specific exonuclease RecJ [Leptothrix ochracea]|uniref:single-stranded-DNA-specific exonuclease RecJ n=2 Tax=Leptothrix ochracea TaxID=735331 RepID=UPI0034E28919
MTSPHLVRRDAPPRTLWSLEQAGVHPLLARLYAARGVGNAAELDDSLGQLLPPTQLLGAAAAATLLADALQAGQRMVVVADYDCDGATACAVALRGLGLLGARPGQVAYVVPDRTVHGYGLTPTIVDLALGSTEGASADTPGLLITVDNGIASLEGVAHARQRGWQVLVTDHHLPAAPGGVVQLPTANVIVNPNQPDCPFASKALAGVGVMFYVLLALRAELRQRGAFDARNQPRLDALLDLVALGTVADVVALDANNRRLVAQGLKRMRAGHLQPGLAALFAAAGRDPARASTQDLGFALGPRLNAAGRLADMRLGIECLLTDDRARAAELAQALDAINRERRHVEAGMREQADAMLAHLDPQASAASDPSTHAQDPNRPPVLVIFDPAFHEGVVGIVAGRLKDRWHRPVFVLARGLDGHLKGSGRSIAGFHLRDALDLVAKRHPEVLKRFGGHAMAAGCTLAEEHLGTFREALERIGREQLDAATLQRKLLTDGPLAVENFTTETVQLLQSQVWGQAFEAPLFVNDVTVVSQRRVGENHLKLQIRLDDDPQATLRDAIWFQHTQPLPDHTRLAFRLSLDEFQGRQKIQLMVEATGA